MNSTCGRAAASVRRPAEASAAAQPPARKTIVGIIRIIMISIVIVIVHITSITFIVASIIAACVVRGGGVDLHPAEAKQSVQATNVLRVSLQRL